MELVNVEKAVLESLYVFYFGADVHKDSFKAAVYRAYRDMNRTIRFNGNNVSKELKENVCAELRSRMSKKNFENQEEFDNWHKETCGQIKRIYDNQGVTLFIGQAQKWINMTFKYLYILGMLNDTNYVDFLHIPIDDVIIKKINDRFGIKAPQGAWSRWDDYDKYLECQKQIRNNLKGVPLKWEIKVWIE